MASIRQPIFHGASLATALLLLGVPTPTLANAGTPLMWAGSLYLLVGNAIIGLLEGALLIKLYKTGPVKTCTLMVLANYASAWLGALFLSDGLPLLVSTLDLNHLSRLFWMAMLTTYGITLLVEFPFIAFSLGRKPGWLTRSIRGTLIVQTLSYAVLMSCCFSVSSTSLFTVCRVVSPDEIAMPGDVMLYYISIEDGDVYERTINAEDDRYIYDLNARNPNDRLLLLPSTTAQGKWDLLARLENEDRQAPELVLIREALAIISAVNERDVAVDREEIPGTWFNFGPVPKLGNADSSQWSFRAGFWWGEGLWGERADNEQSIHIGWETPIARWMVRNATHLPGDKVFFQLGADQICVYDPETNQIALLVKGRGPVVAMESPNDLTIPDDPRDPANGR